LANVEQFQPNYNSQRTTKPTRHESPCGHHVAMSAKKQQKTHYGRGKMGEGQVGVALIMQNKEEVKKKIKTQQLAGKTS